MIEERSFVTTIISENMDNLPAVSIIIITYNHKQLVKSCLSSVLKTNYPNYEIIVVDNGSTDGTHEYIESVCRYVSNVRLILSGVNLGHSEGVNLGCKNAKGEIIAKLDDDTLVDPNWLLESVKLLLIDDCIGAIQSNELSYSKYPEVDVKATRSINPTMDKLGFIHINKFENLSEILYPTGFAFIIKKNYLLQTSNSNKTLPIFRYFLFVKYIYKPNP